MSQAVFETRNEKVAPKIRFLKKRGNPKI